MYQYLLLTLMIFSTIKSVYAADDNAKADEKRRQYLSRDLDRYPPHAETLTRGIPLQDRGYNERNDTTRRNRRY